MASDRLFSGLQDKTSRVMCCDEAADIGKVACVIGVFDGVHAGHRKLVSDCVEFARQNGVRSAIVTFDVDPAEVLSSASPRKLLSNEDRIEMLSRLGADLVLVHRFDEELAGTEPDEFVEKMLAMMDPVAVFVGVDFRFGCHASGDVGLMQRVLGSSGCEVEGEELLREHGGPVSATRIRDLLESGDLAAANSMLGRPFFMRAQVVMGRQVGRTLGYPTANLMPSCDYASICGGVYTGYVFVHGQWFRASISVGVPKTFGDIAPTIEAHLIDFDEDIYGESVVVCFTSYLRPMMKFDSADELIEAIAWYTESAREQPDEPHIAI